MPIYFGSKRSTSPVLGLSPALWLDASQLALANNDPVAEWTDMSGNLRHATASGAARPMFKTNRINGLPGVLFDGTDDYMTGSWVSLECVEMTVFVVMKRVAPTTNIGAVLFFNLGGSLVAGFYHNANETWRLYDGAGNRDLAGWTTTDAVLAAATKNGTTITGTINGVGTTQVSSNWGETDNYNISAYLGGSQYINFEYYEMIVFPTALSDPDREAVESYLNTKYAIY